MAWLAVLFFALNMLLPVAMVAVGQPTMALGFDDSEICHYAPPGVDGAPSVPQGDSQGSYPRHCPLCILLASQAVAPPPVGDFALPAPVSAAIGSRRSPDDGRAHPRDGAQLPFARGPPTVS